LKNNFIPLYKPSIHKQEIKNVQTCLKEGWISSKGKFVSKFENQFKKKFKYRYATVTTNGTTALHLALLSLNLKFGDEVIVPNITFVASVNAISYVGAKPVLVDINKNTWLMDINEITKKITKKTKAIILVHLYGFAYSYEDIIKLKKKYKLKIIEDCAEAIGSKYRNNFVGTLGDVSTFSFYGNKTITTGEGGMVVTKNKDLYSKIVTLKSQGLDIKKFDNFYNHEVVGYNYRMTNICASIGLAQLNKIDLLIKQKKKIFLLYKKLLKENIIFQKQVRGTLSTYWLVTILVKNKKIKINLQKHLKDYNIETRPIFTPMNKLNMYKESVYNYKNSEEIYDLGISLPSYPDLKQKEIKFICDKINIFFK
jgi:perosamine synthetase